MNPPGKQVVSTAPDSQRATAPEARVSFPFAGDTIAAISSATESAARMIVRLSGPDAWLFAVDVAPGYQPAASVADRATLVIRGMSVPVQIYSFQSPRSYTAEDLVEFHLPGNPLLARFLLDELIAKGARLAEPGEFTARAYFHGRLDLTEAEGVAATIAAHSEQELLAARQLLSGELARRLQPIMERISQTLALIEVGIDFTEEEVSFLSPREIASQLGQVDRELTELLDNSARFEKLTHEPTAVLIGRPNAGKSTLLNTLAGHDRAIVSAMAGTTRDAVSASILLEFGALRMIDVAGIDELGAAAQIAVRSNTTTARDNIEQQMRERALRELETADLVLLIHDSSSADPLMEPPRAPDVVIFTKIDLPYGASRFDSESTAACVSVSCETGENIPSLRQVLNGLAFGDRGRGASLALNARHLNSIEDCRSALARALSLASHGDELIALELRHALNALGQILGQVTPDDLLGKIFSTFCIGK